MMARKRVYECSPFGSRCYTGVGSRETPDDVLELMATLAKKLAWSGWHLRSGHADGADLAFEVGAHSAITEYEKVKHIVGVREAAEPDIFLPWASFNGGSAYTALVEPYADAYQMAAGFHPGWDFLSMAARKLHARNCHQVLGVELDDPSEFLVCWTPDASGSGGTGQSIRVARANKVPVYDLGSAEQLDALRGWLAVV